MEIDPLAQIGDICELRRRRRRRHMINQHGGGAVQDVVISWTFNHGAVGDARSYSAKCGVLFDLVGSSVFAQRAKLARGNGDVPKPSV